MNTLPDEKASIDDSHDAAWVQKCVEDFVFLSPENTLGFDHEEKVFDKPLVGFASGSDPLWQDTRQLISAFSVWPLLVIDWGVVLAIRALIAGKSEERAVPTVFPEWED